MHIHQLIESEDVDVEPMRILSLEKAGFSLTLPLDSAAGDGLLSI
jgi:hypothetical protein